MHVDPRRVEARGEGDVELAAGGDVDREPLLGEEPVGGGGREGLAREEDLAGDAAAFEGLAVGVGAGAHVGFGVDVGGGAVRFDQLDDVAAADLEVAALVYPAADRQHGRARYAIARDCPRVNLLRHRRHCDG
jgi:hypothetical protein